MKHNFGHHYTRFGFYFFSEIEVFPPTADVKNVEQRGTFWFSFLFIFDFNLISFVAPARAAVKFVGKITQFVAIEHLNGLGAFSALSNGVHCHGIDSIRAEICDSLYFLFHELFAIIFTISIAEMLVNEQKFRVFAKRCCQVFNKLLLRI